MSTGRKRKSDIEFEQIGDTDVAGYLKTHPDFFERQPALLAKLNLPHDSGDNTVSLIERQVAILRQRNRKLDQKLRELVSVARANDVLARKIHQLAMRLMGTTSLTGMLETVQTALRDDLDSDHSLLVLFGAETSTDDLFEAGFVKRISRDDDRLAQFRTFLDTGRPRCGQITGSKRELLFGDAEEKIRSAALIPLGDRSARGFLAIGSREKARFHPGMSTDFLARLGELVERGFDCVS